MPKLEAYKAFVAKWSTWFSWVSMAGVACLLLLTVSDVVGSKLKMPIAGSYYITGQLLLVIAALGVAYAEIRGRHIRIDIFLVHAPERVKAAFGIFSNLVTTIVVAAVIVNSFLYGIKVYNLHLITLDIGLPLFPFPFVIALGFVPLFLVLIGEFFESIGKVQTK